LRPTVAGGVGTEKTAPKSVALGARTARGCRLARIVGSHQENQIVEPEISRAFLNMPENHKTMRIEVSIPVNFSC